MNNEEAKFILSAYRPDGRDAADPQFAEALAQSERDPELRVWLERQRSFDRTVAERLGAIMPPAGLREAILAGARASQPRRMWWSQPLWLAAAAAIAVATIVGLKLAQPATSARTLEDFARFAAADIVDQHDQHDGFPAGLGEVQARLASVATPLTQGAGVGVEELRRQRCRVVRVGGLEVFELCFNREGTWFHLYVARRGDFAPGAETGRPAIAGREPYTAAAWADATQVYALVARGGEAALRRLL
ncbi:MAG: hypothetical protein JNK23_15955 [Opitutaceae bacterium]|nr:hypothetical protein [Opitutaceae bacterium]